MVDAGAGFVKAQRSENQIYPANSGGRGSQVAELSSHEDIQEAGIDNPDEELVAELEEDGSATIREIEEEDNVVSISVDRLNNSRLSRFFTEEELSCLRDSEMTVTGESKESTYEEAMRGLKADLKERNRQVARERKRREKSKIREAMKDRKYSKEVSNLSGEEFLELIQEGNNGSNEQASEELESALAAVDEKYSSWLDEGDSDTEISNVEVDELSEGLDAFREYGGAFEDIANDVEASSELPDTEITTLSDGKKLVKTSYEDLKDELRQVDNNPEKEGEIVDKQGEVITARVSEGDKF